MGVTRPPGPHAPPLGQPPADDGGAACPRCGAPHELGQEYCVECGLRLSPSVGAITALADAWRRRLRWYPGDWIWPALVLLVIATVGGAVAYLATRGGAVRQVIVATTRVEPAPPPTKTAPTAPAGKSGTRTTPSTETQGAPEAPPPAASGSATLTSWPAGTGGYTTVLQSVPRTSGRAAAVAFARRALSAGLPQVGYLKSSRFTSLHPGYYVVFSGIFDSAGAAQANAATASSKGFPDAYARKITR